MFGTMFDLNTVDCIVWNTSNSQKSCIHLGNQLNVKNSTNACVKILLIYAAANISNSENVKYLNKVGENLIFLFSSMYFIVVVREAEIQKYMFTYHIEGQFNFMFILYLQV